MPSLRRRASQTGSAVVESALIILPLFAVGFAIVDFGFALFIQNTLREAVREGVRYAITQQTGGGGQDAAIKKQVEYYSMGFLNDTDITSGDSTFTIQYYDPENGLALSTGSGSNKKGNVIVVTASIKHKWMAPLWRGTDALTFSATSSDVMEAPPGGNLPAR